MIRTSAIMEIILSWQMQVNVQMWMAAHWTPERPKLKSTHNFFFFLQKTSAKVLLSTFFSWICFVHICRKSVIYVSFVKWQMLVLVQTIFSIKFENNYRVFAAATLCLWAWRNASPSAVVLLSVLSFSNNGSLWWKNKMYHIFAT